MVKELLKYFVLFFFFAVLKIDAQNIEVYAETDTTDYFVGDYIKYRISLNYDDNIKVFPLSIKDSVKSLDFIKEEPPVKSPGKKNQEVYRYVFSKYDSSAVTIPELPIFYTVGNDSTKYAITTNPVSITVHTLDVDPEADIRDVKAPLTIPFDWLIVIIVALVLIVLLIVGYFWYRNYKKKQHGEKFEVPKIVIPPHKIAIKKLYELEEKKLWQQNLIKEYHSEVTGIIREYFEKRFNVLALEMPSSELLDELKNVNDSQQIFDTTREFLENADMVKFAKFKPMPSVNDAMMKQAFEIVNKTKQEEIESKVEEVENAG